MTGEWLTININPPTLDTTIVARTANKFGLGSSKEIFEFDSRKFNKEDAMSHLLSHSFIEWLELPE